MPRGGVSQESTLTASELDQISRSKLEESSIFDMSYPDVNKDDPSYRPSDDDSCSETDMDDIELVLG